MIFNDGDNSKILLNYDLAIVGAGVAGIILAIEMEQSGLRVAVFESGDFEFSKNTQDLYRGEVAGKLIHAPLDAYRMRFFGGSTNCWGGGCVPYDRIDFQERPYLAHSGWPLDYNSLEPYYHRASNYLEIGSFDYSKDRGEIISGIGKTKTFTTKYWKRANHSPKFNIKYRDFFKNSKTVDLFLNSNFYKIGKLDERNHITSIYLQDYSGNQIKVDANQFVLAMGGIEGTRLLLNSKHIFSTAAMERTYENIGRYYSPHVNLEHGTFVPAPGIPVISDYVQVSEAVQLRRFLTLSDFAINKYELLNCKTTLETAQANAAPLTDNVYSYLHGNTIFGGLDEKIDLYNSKLKDYLPERASNRLRIKRRHSYILDTAFEQEPNWNSKIELIQNKDKFGLKKVRLTFNAKQSDFDRYLKYFELLSRTVGELGLGRLSYDHTGKVFFEQVSGASHHTGATRMSKDYREGVVDCDCRVHGISNLFISSASIFPTPGHANPTFTIAGMAIRLADYLKRQ
jgi:choline dehydrogenase-like flavoprotein